MLWFILCTCMALLARGKRLKAGKHHSKANFHMVVQLPSGIASTHVRFVDCTPSCANGQELYSTDDVTTDDNIRVQSLDEGAHLYDIQYEVPVEQQRPHILMAVRASDCSSASCESTEESFLDCRQGSIKDGDSCSECNAGKYQNEGECAVCVAGRASSVGAVTCHKCPSGHTSLEGAAECERCAEDFYALSGDRECTKCPAGRVSKSGSSSCDAGPPPVAEVKQTIKLFGVTRANVEATVLELAQALSELVGAPVEIISIGGMAPIYRGVAVVSRGRRLSTGVDVEYRVLVTKTEQLAEVEERTRRLQESPDELVTEFKSLIQDVPDIDIDAITVSVGEFVTTMLSVGSVFSRSNILYITVPAAIGALMLALLVWYLCKTDNKIAHVTNPLYLEPLVARQQKERLVLEPLIQVQNTKKIKF